MQLKKQNDINNQNKNLLYRLMSTPSAYPKKNWEKHASKHFWAKERICTNTSNHKMMMSMRQKYQDRVMHLKSGSMEPYVSPSVRGQVRGFNHSGGVSHSQNQVGFLQDGSSGQFGSDHYNDDKYFTQYSNQGQMYNNPSSQGGS